MALRLWSMQVLAAVARCPETLPPSESRRQSACCARAIWFISPMVMRLHGGAFAFGASALVQQAGQLVVVQQARHRFATLLAAVDCSRDG